MTRCFQCVSYWESVQTRAAVKYPVYLERSEHGAQHVVLQNLFVRFRLAGLKDRIQTLEVKCQKSDIKSAFKVLSIRTRDVCVAHRMADQAVTPGAGPLFWHRIQAGNVRSSRRLLTRIRSIEYYTKNLDLNKTTILYLSCNQFCSSAHQSHRFSLFCIVRRSWSNGLRVDRPCFWKCQRIVRAEFGRAKIMPTYWLMVTDVVIRFCRPGLTVCLFPGVLVMGGRWDPACCSV